MLLSDHSTQVFANEHFHTSKLHHASSGCGLESRSHVTTQDLMQEESSKLHSAIPPDNDVTEDKLTEKDKFSLQHVHSHGGHHDRQSSLRTSHTTTHAEVETSFTHLPGTTNPPHNALAYYTKLNNEAAIVTGVSTEV